MKKWHNRMNISQIQLQILAFAVFEVKISLWSEERWNCILLAVFVSHYLVTDGGKE